MLYFPHPYALQEPELGDGGDGGAGGTGGRGDGGAGGTGGGDGDGPEPAFWVTKEYIVAPSVPMIAVFKLEKSSEKVWTLKADTCL